MEVKNMAEEKDFLSQFSNTNKPDSFKEEVRTPVVKQKKPINKVALIIVVVILLLACILAYFLFLAPKIEMPDFVNKTKNDVAAWVKQQEIESSGIIFNEEYNFDYDADTIMSQDIEAGAKVRNDVKITFTVSKGADPDEVISVPDIKSMEKDEIKEWISDNKLTKTKITTVYDDNVEENKVVSYAFSGCDEDSFTRSSTLKINVSKGAAPAGTITVTDFVDKYYSDVESWSKTNKINVSKSEAYSDTVEKGIVISQSVAGGKTIKQDETLKVVVSKGKAIYMVDMSNYTDSEAISWFANNQINSYKTSKTYSWYSEGEVIDYSPAAGTILNDRDDIEITISLGNRVSLSNLTEGMSLDKFVAVISDLNNQGAQISIDKKNEDIYSYDYKKNQISSIECKTSDNKDCDLDNAPFNAKISYTLSKGKVYVINLSEDLTIYDNSKLSYKLIKITDILTDKEITYVVEDTRTEPTEYDGNTECQIFIGDSNEPVELADGKSFEIIEGNKVTLKVIG